MTSALEYQQNMPVALLASFALHSKDSTDHICFAMRTDYQNVCLAPCILASLLAQTFVERSPPYYHLNDMEIRYTVQLDVVIEPQGRDSPEKALNA